MLWYFSRDRPPQDLKQRELTFQSPACREREKKGKDKTRGKEGVLEKARRRD